MLKLRRMRLTLFGLLVFSLMALSPAVVVAADLSSFPMASGNSWLLVNQATGATASVTIQSSRMVGNKRIVDMLFENPSWSLTMIVSPESGLLTMEGIAFPAARYYLEGGGVLFSELAARGQQWSSPLGAVALISTNISVATPAGTFTGCRQFRIDFGGGNTMDWYLAPGVGVVRLGTNSFPFVLRSYTAAPNAPPGGSSIVGECPKVGIIPNPPANGDFSPAGELQALTQAIAAGSRFLHISANWADLEPQPGSYNFTDISREFGWAQQYGLTAALTIKTVDSNLVSLPSDLLGQRLDSPTVIARFRALLQAIAPIIPAAVKWVNLANETNNYFATHPADLMPFLNFYLAGVQQLKQSGRSMPVGMSFSFADYRRDDAYYRILQTFCEQISFVYYPLRQDGTIRGPAVVNWDFGEMVAAAAGKPLVLTEIGLPSSTLIGSSNTLQQQFYSSVFDELERYPTKIGGANFFLMSDIPQAIVDSLAAYYQQPGGQQFLAFLATLGLYDTGNLPKPAWSVFATRARALAGATSCTSRPVY